jgi:four helix bundle protein
MSMSLHKPIEETPVFATFDEASDQIWDLVVEWDSFAKWTFGKQLVEAADSVAANLVEGDGRFSDADANRFFITARASARETKHWLKKAVKRGLLPERMAPA